MPATNKHATTFTTPSDTDVVVTRTFDAPRKLVFEAYTNCKHMPHWMGPHGWTMSGARTTCALVVKSATPGASRAGRASRSRAWSRKSPHRRAS